MDIYEPTIDIPGVPGADQTLWFVTNDLNSGQPTYFIWSKILWESNAR